MKDRENHKTVYNKRMFTNPWNGVIRLGIEHIYDSKWNGPYVSLTSDVSSMDSRLRLFADVVLNEVDMKETADYAKKVGTAIIEFAETLDNFDWVAFRARCEKYAATKAPKTHLRPLETEIVRSEEALDAPKPTVKKAVKKADKKAPKPPKKAAEATEGGAE